VAPPWFYALTNHEVMYIYIFPFSLDSSLCLSKETEVEGTKDNLEVDENIQSPPVSPVSSFQSCSKTAGTAELEDELVSHHWVMCILSPRHVIL
jgi:hypothetical protein